MRHLLLAVTTLGIALSAHAVEHEQVSSKFSFTKQQLQSEDGAKQVLEQLTQNLRKACQVEHTYRQVVSGRVDHKCFDQMMADAVSKIDAPFLTAAYQAQLQ